MLGFFKKKETSPAQKQTVVFKLNGLHCTSCSLNIDGALEDTPGVWSATTSYAHSTTRVEFDPMIVGADQLSKVIVELGYSVVTKEL